MDRILSVLSDEQGNAYFLLSELHHFLLNGFLLVFTIEEVSPWNIKRHIIRRVSLEKKMFYEDFLQIFSMF